MTSGSLTSLLYLMVFLSLIDQAKEECFDYFDSPTWENHAPDMVRLQTEKNSTDVVECTLEHLCVNHHSDKPCHILRDCFGRKSATMNIKSESGNCVAHLSDDPIHILHFICIAAKKLKVPDKVKVDKNRDAGPKHINWSKMDFILTDSGGGAEGGVAQVQA
ncbi:uncharacterized protein ACBR49_012387 [Aulostomus maculatus]